MSNSSTIRLTKTATSLRLKNVATTTASSSGGNPFSPARATFFVTEGSALFFVTEGTTDFFIKES